MYELLACLSNGVFKSLCALVATEQRQAEVKHFSTAYALESFPMNLDYEVRET